MLNIWHGLETMLVASECKFVKVRFEATFKNSVLLHAVKIVSEVRGQGVPNGWSGMAECSAAANRDSLNPLNPLFHG